MRLTLMRSGNALLPADAESAEAIAKLKHGEGFNGEFRRARNLKFHRKGFSLLKFAFDHWENKDLEYKGRAVAKEFTRFRKDITILAGFYRPVYNVRGEVRLEADSLSFGSMDDERFAEVYKAILNVVWQHVMSKCGYLTAEDVDSVVNRLMAYE